MKNFIFALVASLLLPAIGFSQSTVQQVNNTFYLVPVPNDLKASDKGSGKTLEKMVKLEKVVYTVQIQYNPNSKKDMDLAIDKFNIAYKPIEINGSKMKEILYGLNEFE